MSETKNFSTSLVQRKMKVRLYSFLVFLILKKGRDWGRGKGSIINVSVKIKISVFVRRYNRRIVTESR